MLDDAYFATLDGHQSERHLESLPLWGTRVYERELRAVASWWSIRARHKRRFPTLTTPRPERLLTLPLWAQHWLATLRFEIWWQQDQACPLVRGPSRATLFQLRRRTTPRRVRGLIFPWHMDHGSKAGLSGRSIR